MGAPGIRPGVVGSGFWVRIFCVWGVVPRYLFYGFWGGGACGVFWGGMVWASGVVRRFFYERDREWGYGLSPLGAGRSIGIRDMLWRTVYMD